MMEVVINVIWKPVTGYEGLYDISSTGLVRSLERSVPHLGKQIKIRCKILSTRINNSGYLEVRLSKQGHTSTKFIHVLKAQAFVPNPDNKKEVNHKDGNKLNNENWNLEWVTHRENIQHAYRKGLCKGVGVKVIDMCSGKTYLSIQEAANDLQINYGTCRNYLSGNIKENKTCLEYAA